MSNRRYTPEFKDEAVRQVVERGFRVAEVAERLGVSSNSLHKWVKAIRPTKVDEQTAELNDAKKEILKLRAELRRVQEERDILKKAARYFASQPELYLGISLAPQSHGKIDVERRDRQHTQMFESFATKLPRPAFR